MKFQKACFYCRSTDNVNLVEGTFIHATSVYVCEVCQAHVVKLNFLNREKSDSSLQRKVPVEAGFVNEWIVPHMLD